MGRGTEWHAAFATVTQPVPLADLILFGDCFYLPYTFGPTASALYHQARWLLAHPPAEWGEAAVVFRQHAARLLGFCVRLTELQQRTLFYSLSRRLWELREEIDLFDRYVAFKSNASNAALPVQSDYHLPGTYRGGFVAELQRLLQQNKDESLVPTEHPAAAPAASSAQRRPF